MSARVLYALVLIGYFGIMLLLPLWYAWLAPPGIFPPKLVLLVLGLPLFAPLRGLLHARRYTVAWSLFLSLLYFTHACMEAFSNPQARWLAATELVLSLCWLIGGIAWLRLTNPARARTTDPAQS